VNRRRFAALLALTAALAGCAELRARFPGPDVLFIATPEGVSVEMLRLAAVTAQDVVFDLGSGDGRVVVAAARDFGARAVGVEIDAKLVSESRDLAYGEGVTARTSFLWQDLFVTDLTEATVVTLYLRDDVNLRLRPKLLRELKPGTRVVSHDFDMGDWPADRVQKVRGPARNHTLYLWVIPADAAGAWNVQFAGREARMALDQRYQTLTGTFGFDDVEAPISDGRVAGDRITFRAGPITFSGRLVRDTIEGRVTREAGATPSDWSARRVR
jgi:SAM-dependent methyltransferase